MKKILPPTIFVALACFLLLMYYSDMLFTAQWRTPFMQGELFRQGMLAEPFGWMAYVGCWLTQSFFTPVMGVLLLALIWVASWKALTKALDISQDWSQLMMLPLGCLVLSITDMGYLIYCLDSPGYWFAQSLGYLLFAVLLWALTLLPKGVVSLVTQVMVCFAFYPVIGWCAYLLALCLLLRQRNWWCMLCIFAPALWHTLCYDGVSMYSMWVAGFPLFANNAGLVLRPSLPFCLLTVLTLVWAIVPLRRSLGVWQWTIGLVALTLVTAGGVWAGSYKDYNYLAEMRMTRAAMDDDWKTVLSEAAKTKRPSRTMVALKNVALFNTGHLADRSFALGNDGRDINNPDSLSLNIMHIAAPLVYYNHGMVNYAARWCVENAVRYGYSPYYLQMMARCAMATGEQQLARRTLDLLHGASHYSDWQPREVSRTVKNLRATFANVIDADNNSCEHYIIDIYSCAQGTSDPLVQELGLFYATLHGSPSRFWPAFIDYLQGHPGELLPQHFQEAYFHFMEHYPLELPVKVNISQQTAEGYTAFRKHFMHCQQSGADKATIGEAMRADWGGTCWWHLYFGRSEY